MDHGQKTEKKRKLECKTKLKLIEKLDSGVSVARVSEEYGLFFLICILGGGVKVHWTLRPLNGLVCQPRVIMIMEKSVE
jgi:hypothetical protein